MALFRTVATASHRNPPATMERNSRNLPKKPTNGGMPLRDCVDLGMPASICN